MAKFIGRLLEFIIYGTFEYINRKGPVLIHTPLVRSFGNCGEEIYFGLLKARREGKRIKFLCPRRLFGNFPAKIANRELFNIESDYYLRSDCPWRHLGDWAFTALFATLRALYLLWRASVRARKLLWPKYRTPRARKWYPEIMIGRSSLWSPEGVSSFSWDVVRSYGWNKQFEEYLPVKLAPEKRRQAEQVRVQMGIPFEDWFVCLHVREEGYLKGIERSIAKYRNASILNYIDGIRAITDAGGWVVRLGDSTMTQLPRMERVIDYPHTSFKSEVMDMYLLSECRFYVGKDSGPLDVARLFQKPEVLINMTEWSLAFPMRKGDLGILKHIYSRSRGRFLSLKEILADPLFECQTLSGGPGNDYIMFENTPEEIRDVIEEFLSRPTGYRHSELQVAFNDARRTQIRHALDQDLFPPRVLIEKYRFASRTYSVAGALGQKYLEQNWINDSMNEKLFSLPLAESLGTIMA